MLSLDTEAAMLAAGLNCDGVGIDMGGIIPLVIAETDVRFLGGGCGGGAM